MALHVFGIRHHGPGCARSLRAALEALAPDVVLIEGPADAQGAIEWAGHEAMVPPLALLVHAADEPRNAMFYPFAEFSPEWQAMRYAAERKIPARFMDLPCTHKLALLSEAAEKKKADTEASEHDDDGHDDGNGEQSDEDAASDLVELAEDPIGLLAEAAGFADREQWWDAQVEQRRDHATLFDGILEAMTALREDHVERRQLEDQREAFMRNTIRGAQKEGFERIAIVCGAWHAPRLAELGPAKRDAELLKGLPKIKIAATWIPWTHSRLSFRSGYGAGVDSPGWYAHVWAHGEQADLRWATLAARLLRAEDIDASSANVIETVRLARALAAVRELATPGLAELRDAIDAVLCGGDKVRLALIRKKLEIGEALGSVPAQASQVPIQLDFERHVKRLRLALSVERRELDLDLRKETDLERSRLLHRLKALGVDWGTLLPASKGAGTFRERWAIAFNPELAVELIAANLHGNTVESAANAALEKRARESELAQLTALVETATLAALPAALDTLLGELDQRAATSSDVRLQLLALEPLARIVRYSDVRATRAEHVLPVLKALFERVAVGLSPACTQLDDDAAAQMVEAINRGHAACFLLEDAPLHDEWLEAIGGLRANDAAHARIRGRACRMLHEQKALAEGELARAASLELSTGVEPATAAQWVEGLVAGEGMLLVHQDELLGVLDAWLAQLSDDVFTAQLPLLRRALSSLTPPERRNVAAKVKHGATASRVAKSAPAEALQPEWTAQVLPVLAELLGVRHD